MNARTRTIVDPARLIWGDAVVNEAIRIDQAAYQTGGFDNDGIEHTAGWVHTSGVHPNAAICCIVGHLNWIAAEQAGLDPLAGGISTWPSTDEALIDLSLISEVSGRELPRLIDLGDGMVVEVESIVTEMIDHHDAVAFPNQESWWGEELTEWVRMNIADRAEEVETWEADLAACVPELVPV
jgi:hypothetical protein